MRWPSSIPSSTDKGVAGIAHDLEAHELSMRRLEVWFRGAGGSVTGMAAVGVLVDASGTSESVDGTDRRSRLLG